jgi:hypothetical protein
MACRLAAGRGRAHRVEKRRNYFRRIAGALSCAAALGGPALGGAALACELPPGVRVESERLTLSYWTIPANIVVGKPFALELAACPKKGARQSEMRERIKLDAHMPEHRHGMNYRTKVVLLGPGRYHSEGWLFHMPGRWEFVFDIGAERLTHSVRIE